MKFTIHRFESLWDCVRNWAILLQISKEYGMSWGRVWSERKSYWVYKLDGKPFAVFKLEKDREKESLVYLHGGLFKVFLDKSNPVYAEEKKSVLTAMVMEHVLHALSGRYETLVAEIGENNRAAIWFIREYGFKFLHHNKKSGFKLFYREG